MDLYLIWIIIGIILIIIELLTPSMFFLNLGIACLITAFFTYLGFSQVIQAIIFLISAGILLFFVKPIMQKMYNKKAELNDKYINQIAKVIQRTDKNDGRITIYGEDWQAKSNNEEDIFEINENVKIVKRDSLIMYVEKI